MKNKEKVPIKSNKKVKNVKDAKIPKKGGKFIAPKKQKLQQDLKYRKGLENRLRNKLEDELKSKAAHEGKSFKFLSSIDKSKLAKKKKK